MPSSYTTSLRLTLPATGELTGTWGNTVNTGITELLDAAVAGTATLSTWGGAGVAYTLSNNSGSADEARRMFLVATGAPGEAKNIICPAVSKFYVLRNDTTGGFALTLKTPAGSGIAVPAGQYKFLYCNGTDVVEMFNSVGALILSGALTANGATTFAANPTFSAGTANQVQFLNASKVLSGSTNLTFDGTTLTAANFADSSLTNTRVVYSGASGNLTDSANFTFNGTDLTVTGAVNAGSINATTLDLTNIEVTNIKAKDGTASASIADTTGAFTVSAAFAANGNTTLGDVVGDIVTINGTTTFVNAAPTLTPLTASQAVFTNGSKTLVSNAITGTGNVVMSASPTLTGTVAGASLQLSSLNSGRVTYAGASGLLQDSANLTFNGTDLTVSGAINATTFDMTNLEVTNIKAKDGTAAASIANTTGIITVSSQLNVDNLNLNGNTLSSTDVNGNIVLAPNGTGDVQVDADTLRVGDSGAAATITTNGAGNLTLNTNAGTNSGAILINQGVNGNIELTPNGTGDVYLNSDTVRIGDSNADATLTTNGTGDLILNTNAGTNSGSITIADAANGNISLVPNGNGSVVVTSAGTSDALRITQTGTGNAILVEDSANPDATPFVVTAAGIAVAGHTASIPGAFSDEAALQCVVAGGAAQLAGYRFSANTGGTNFYLYKSRGTTAGTNTIVQSGDILGALNFAGADGTTYHRAAAISTEVDGTPGTNDMPGRLVFSTTADGASTPTERMRIDSAGNVGIGTSSLTGFNFRVQQNLTGSTTPQAVRAGGQIQSDATSESSYFVTSANTAASAFTLPNLYHYIAQQGTFGVGSSVTNQYGYSVAASLIGATNNFGFYSNIASGTGRWNFYASGTAQNYFAGNTLIGTLTNTNSSALVVNGTISETVSAVQYLVASQYDVGTDPNDIPVNGYLGSMAYQDASYVSVTQLNAGTVSATTLLEQGKPVVTSADIGTGANQIPLNQYLGAMAYQDSVSTLLGAGGGVTLGTGTICKGTFVNSDGVKRATIILDLTGLTDGGTAGDIIGSTSTAIDATKQPAFVAQLPVGFTVLGGRMTCLEAPAGGGTDIDLYSATEGTGVQDSAVSALTEAQLVNGGVQALGTVSYFIADPAAQSYLYMVSQGTGAATYTAGRFLIEIFGV